MCLNILRDNSSLVRMVQPTTSAIDLSAQGPSPSHSPSMRGRGDSSFALVKGGSTKQACLMEGGEQVSSGFLLFLLLVYLSP